MEMEMTMQYERGFKLVSVADDNTYWSWSSLLSGEVEYKIGEWTVPLKGNGPLAVFDNVDNLLRFCVSVGWHKCCVFEAEYIRSTERALWVDPAYKHILPLPAGTVFASQVRLLREIMLDSKARGSSYDDRI